jgi:chromosome segregation ATPase
MNEEQMLGAAEPSQEGARQPSRIGGWMRRALRWIVLLVIAFALGVGATWAARVRPDGARIQALSTSLSQAQDQLQAQNSELADLRPLRSANASLQDQLNAAQNRILLLQALVDVTGAQVALAQGKTQQAQQSLSGTDARLQELGASIGPSYGDQVTALRGRLKLASGELESDAFAAGNDLEVLASNLANLDKTISAP